MLKDEIEKTEDPTIESSTLLKENESSPEISNVQSNIKVSNKYRTILWYIIFSGFGIHYIIRSNINMAILAMVVQRKPSNSSEINTSECYNRSALLFQNDSESRGHDDGHFKKSYSIERRIMDVLQIKYNQEGFEWNEYQQGLFLGSYYWLNFATQLPGGYLAKRHGTKLIFGVSILVAGAMNFLIPISAYLDFKILLLVRIIQGILSGFCWPSMHDLISKWIPPNERSRFGSAYVGGSVGIVIFYPLFGYIISISSWEWIYHFTAALTILWFIFWQYFVHDNPSKHPRIHPSELNYITKSLGDSVQVNNKIAIPWKSILTSVPFWLTVFALWGGVWAIFTIIIQLPTYFKYIHGLDDQTSGLLSGLPHVLRLAFSYISSIYFDYLLQTGKMSRTNVRKYAVFINCIVCGLLTAGLAYSGCNFTMAMIFIALSELAMGAQGSGPLISMVDLAPNFSSVLFGIATTVNVLPGALSSYIVGRLTLNNQTVQQWKYVFLISAGMSFTTGAFYVLFGSSDEQSWNKSSSKSREMKQLSATAQN